MTLAEHVHVGPVATLDRVGQAWSSTGLGARIGTAAGVAASVVVSGGRVLVALTGVLMVAAALVDVREHRLPNALVGAATATGAAGALQVHRLAPALCGATIACGLLLWVRLARGLGLGDVKMGAAVGLSTAGRTLVAAPLSIAIAALLAAATGLALRRDRLPLGPALWCGWALALALPKGWWS